MVFGKKISTHVVNFLFYLPGKAVRRGYPRGEQGNVKGGNGVIALRPVKKRTTTDQRKEKKKNEIIGPTSPVRFIPEERDPGNPRDAFPAFLHRQYSREIRFNRIKGDTTALLSLSSL